MDLGGPQSVPQLKNLANTSSSKPSANSIQNSSYKNVKGGGALSGNSANISNPNMEIDDNHTLSSQPFDAQASVEIDQTNTDFNKFNLMTDNSVIGGQGELVNKKAQSSLDNMLKGAQNTDNSNINLDNESGHSKGSDQARRINPHH